MRFPILWLAVTTRLEVKRLMLTISISTALRVKSKIEHQESLVTHAEGVLHMLLAVFLNVHVRFQGKAMLKKQIALVPFKFF